MTDIYLEIAKLTDKFRTMAYGLTTDEVKINDAVQELMLYFMQMNPDTLKGIYEKDGVDGLTRYGAVALRRALTSTRSPFYYKYEKYYTHINGFIYNYDTTDINDCFSHVNRGCKNLSNIPNEDVDNTQLERLELIDKELDKLDYWYDRELFKLYYYEAGSTLDKIHKKTRISRNSIFTTIDKVRNIIKKNLNEDV